LSYRRPHFVREESWRYKRVKESWRAPRGKTSRVRRSKEGWPPVVKIGYARPASIRGRHPSGLTEVMVWRPQDLEQVNPKTDAVRIAHTVGENKRVQILDQAKKANIRVLNPGMKKEAAPEVVAEPAAPTEPTAEAVTEATPVPAEHVAPEPESAEKETEKETTKKPKKRKAGKSSKKRSRE